MNLKRVVGLALTVAIANLVHSATQSDPTNSIDTAASGNSNSGHDYGTKLSDNQKHDLMEYLKTL